MYSQGANPVFSHACMRMRLTGCSPSRLASHMSSREAVLYRNKKMAYDNRFLARLVLPLAPGPRTVPIYVQACTAAVRARCFFFYSGRQLIWGRYWGSLHMYVRAYGSLTLMPVGGSPSVQKTHEVRRRALLRSTATTPVGCPVGCPLAPAPAPAVHDLYLRS